MTVGVMSVLEVRSVHEDFGARWLVWYRFARDKLDSTHDEAVTYANVRIVEEENRERLAKHRAA